MKAFEQYVEFHTNGDIDVQLLHGGVGGDREILESVATASSDDRNNRWGSCLFLSGCAGLLDAISVPLDPPCCGIHEYRTGHDDFVADVEKEAGLRIVGFAADGFRNFVNNKHPIKTPADVEGLKLRSMESPVMIALMKSLGAAPTPIPFPESAMAIRQGVVDGGENPPSTVINGPVGLKSSNICLLMSIFSLLCFAYANPAFLDGLSEQNRAAVLDGVNLYTTIMLAGKGQGYLSDTQKISDMGVEVYVNSPDEKKAFGEKAQKPVREFLSEELGTDYVDGFLAAVSETEAKLYGE